MGRVLLAVAVGAGAAGLAVLLWPRRGGAAPLASLPAQGHATPHPSPPSPTMSQPSVDPTTASGRAIVTAGGQLGDDARERLYDDALAAGNATVVWMPLRINLPDGRAVDLSVSADYLMVGRADPVRVPLFPATAQRAADRLGALLPTAALVDAVWRAAPVKLTPRPMTPRAGAGRNSSTLLLEQEALINRELAGRTGIVAGDKKDLIVGAELSRNPGKVVIYGWHRQGGDPIQPPYAGHSAHYVDYSHGTRLVHRGARIAGVPVALEQLFADPNVAPALNRGGVLRADQLRYPT